MKIPIRKMTKAEAGKKGADATYKKRYDTIKELSKYIHKDDLSWFQSHWKTEQLLTLLKAYQHE